jgi:hypothetical protein
MTHAENVARIVIEIRENRRGEGRERLKSTGEYVINKSLRTNPEDFE